MLIPTLIGVAIALTANNTGTKAGGLAIAILCRITGGN